MGNQQFGDWFAQAHRNSLGLQSGAHTNFGVGFHDLNVDSLGFVHDVSRPVS
jgi:hypothetical protein